DQVLDGRRAEDEGGRESPPGLPFRHRVWRPRPPSDDSGRRHAGLRRRAPRHRRQADRRQAVTLSGGSCFGSTAKHAKFVVGAQCRSDRRSGTAVGTTRTKPKKNSSDDVSFLACLACLAFDLKAFRDAYRGRVRPGWHLAPRDTLLYKRTVDPNGGNEWRTRKKRRRSSLPFLPSRSSSA